jgi:hypothetical protein
VGVGDVLRFNWTVEALEGVEDQGLQPTEVQAALTGPGPRLLQRVNGDVLRVVARTPTGLLVEVWLTEQVDGEYDIWTAFEAGAISRARWINAFGEDR